MGIYFEGKKIGTTQLWIYPLENVKEEGIEVKSVTFMRFGIFGERLFLEFRSTIRLNPKMQPSQFEINLLSGPYEMRFLGKRENTRWKIETKGSFGTFDQKEITAEENLFPAPALGAFLSLIKWDRQRHVQFSVFDPFTLTILPVHIRVVKSTKE